MSKTKNRDSKDSKARRVEPPPPAPAAAPLADTPSALPGILRWFVSRTVRHASAMRKHVQKLIDHQRDILSPQALEALVAGNRELRAAIAGGAGQATLEKQMEQMEATANKWLKPYPNAAWRENVEVLLVALTVAMGIRTFFLQPFKIPTGSMQPTLFGVTSTNLKNEPNFIKPSGWAGVREWFAGVSYIHKVAAADGTLESIAAPFGLPIFYFWQTIVVGGQSYTIWFPPDYGAPPGGTLEARAGLRPGQFFHKGEDIVNLRVVAGDHLFVDRVSYNFVAPARGDVVVFETKGIPDIMQDTFYIKRLVGLGGETLALHHDYDIAGVPGLGSNLEPVGNLVINGVPITSSTPHFEHLYAFDGASPKATVLPYRENHYYGHSMNMPMQRNLVNGSEFSIQADHYFVMGDNTMNSADSRYWGDFPATQVIGKSFFVYWPITERFGCGYHR